MNQYDNPDFSAAYAQMACSQQGLAGAGEWRQLQKLFPELSGKNVLDLGCGYGWHCHYAVASGAESVLGVDWSERMITEALRRNAGPKITCRVCSLQDFDYPADTYDLVIANLVLHCLDDLDALYRSVYRTLRAGGTFLINIEHPTFTAGVNQQFSADGT